MPWLRSTHRFGDTSGEEIGVDHTSSTNVKHEMVSIVPVSISLAPYVCAPSDITEHLPCTIPTSDRNSGPGIRPDQQRLTRLDSGEMTRITHKAVWSTGAGTPLLEHQADARVPDRSMPWQLMGNGIRVYIGLLVWATGGAGYRMTKPTRASNQSVRYSP